VLSWKAFRFVIGRMLILGLFVVLGCMASWAAFLRYHDIQVPLFAFITNPRVKVFEETLATGRPFEFTTDFYGLKYKGHSDELIDARVLARGGFEKPTLMLMKDLMEALAPGGTFVDVGANVGQHSLFMSRYAGIIHAFDPYEPVLNRFREMIAMNNIGNIQIHAVGLGANNESIPFFEPLHSNPGAGSFLKDWNSKTTRPIQLRIVQGDSYFERQGIHDVDLIKLDIEGYEKQALKGLSRALKNDRPVVVMELNFGADPRYRDMADVISSFPDNYLFYNYYPYGMGDEYSLSAVDASSKPRARTMLAAIPKDKAPLVRMTNAK